MADTDLNRITSSQLIHFELPAEAEGSGPQSGYLPYTGYLTPPQIATAYNIPASTGAGIKIGIIAPLGGGFLQSDLDQDFVDMVSNGLLPAGTVAPTIHQVLLDGTTGTFTGAGADIENTLDIYCVAALVPAANISIYFCSNWDNAIIQAINDGCHVLNISYAYSVEPMYGIPSFESTFSTAANAKVAICAAAGDNGSLSNSLTSITNAPYVGYPCGSPQVISVGGTKLTLNTDNTRKTETDDNKDPGFGNTWGGGGGISEQFDLPDFQAGLHYTPILFNVTGSPTPLAKRGVPDISAPMNGYVMYFNGTPVVVGGTSAAAPVMAGILARMQKLTGRQRSSYEYNKMFYDNNPVAWHDITVGTNNDTIPNGYAGTNSWDAVTGLGPIIGDVFYQILAAKVRFPKLNYSARPTSGRLWPRARARIRN